MDAVKIRLKEDYNSAVRSFNNKEYRSFVSPFRKTIEWLPKLMIYDIIGDEDVANDLLEGKKKIFKKGDGLTYGIEDSNRNLRPTGKNLPLLVPKVFFYKHPEVCSSYNDKDKERLRRGLESCSSEFARLYDLVSVWEHTGSTELDISKQAISCAAFLVGYFDYIKSNKVLSVSTLSFFDTLDVFSIVDDNNQKDFKEEINDLITKLEQSEAALFEAQALQLEAEKQKLEAESRNSELEAEIEKKQRIIDELNAKLALIPNPTASAHKNSDESEDDDIATVGHPTERLTLSQALRIKSAAWDVDEETMDDDQLDLIDRNNEKSMLVTGCAGSGKTVIAMHKAEQVAKTGASVILIAYTKSLSAFMREGLDIKSLPYSFYHHYRWKENLGMPHADYIIVDEIQDFTREEIIEFMNAANKAYFFFGDSAQSIYKQYGKNTISIEEISDLTGLTPMRLYNNYRLPRTIAKITQGYVGVDVNPYEDRIYQNREMTLPHFVSIPDFEGQIKAISGLIEKYARDIFDNKKIGILLPSNELVIKICRRLQENDTPCEFRYNIPDSVKSIDTLDFDSFLPKIMTYHSAKGLQFDVVILPMFVSAADKESRKALYVAMTRAMHHLYLLYTTPALEVPLADVPSHLYVNKL